MAVAWAMLLTLSAMAGCSQNTVSDFTSAENTSFTETDYNNAEPESPDISDADVSEISETDSNEITADINYSIELNNSANQKEFIDDLRTLNGNLSVILVLYKYDDKVYES